MEFRIIYGKSGSGKTTEIFKEIKEKIKDKNKIYIVVPEQFSFSAENHLLETIDGNSSINAEVLTLSRMADRVIQEVLGNVTSHLSKIGKSMIVYDAIDSLKKNMNFLRSSDKNLELALRMITEFKKHNVNYKMLKDTIEKVDDKYLQLKLTDTKNILEKYQKRIEGNYIDEADRLDLLAQNIELVDFFNDAVIYIDEFAGFTPNEYQIIEKLCTLAKEITVTICTDSLEKVDNMDESIYYFNKITAEKLLEIAERNGCFIDRIDMGEPKKFLSKELQNLEKSIYSVSPTKWEDETEDISIFSAQTPMSEIENVAKTILKLVKEDEYRFRDIAVVCANIDTYSSLIRSIFVQYYIPVFIDEKRDLNQNIIVQYLLSIFEIFSNNFSKEAVFNYLKIGFSDIENDDIFKLENYCTKWGIKHNKWKNDFTYGINDDNKEEIEYLNRLRKQIIEPLLKLRSKFGTVKETTKAVYEFMQEQQIEGKINTKISELQELGQIDLANEYIASYKIILDIFDEMVLIFGEEKLSVAKYMQILKTGLKNSELGKIPGTQDQVIVGDVERSRSHKVDTIFIIGLNDGSFPSINKAEGFFGDKDREILKQDGIELANGTIENLYEENFNIYKAFTTAEKQKTERWKAEPDGRGCAEKV